MLKNIIVSILIGSLAYLAIHFIQNKDLIPASTPAILELAIICIAIFAGTIASTGLSAPAEPAEPSVLETGTVKWFNVKKGYGFITRDQGDDVFVHFRNIEGEGRRSITDDDRVSFIVINGTKGLQADKVNTI